MRHLPPAPRVLIGILATALLIVAGPARAQLRYAAGFIEAEYGEIPSDEIMPPFPALNLPSNAPKHLIVPVRPTGAVISGGTAQGDPVQMPLADEWALTTSGTLPQGEVTGIQSLHTLFEARNDRALLASGKGWVPGGGPGGAVFNPAAAPIPAATYTTRTFAAEMNPLGSTTSSGVVVTRTFPSMPAQPTLQFRARTTAGPRQFGGSAALLVDTLSTISVSGFPEPTPTFVKTNGRCPPNAALGECKAGYRIGFSNMRTRAEIYRPVGGDASLILPWRWYALPWTTGTASVVAAGDSWSTSFARTGTDIGGSARQLTLVALGPDGRRRPDGPTLGPWDDLVLGYHLRARASGLDGAAGRSGRVDRHPLLEVAAGTSMRTARDGSR